MVLDDCDSPLDGAARLLPAGPLLPVQRVRRPRRDPRDERSRAERHLASVINKR